MSREYIIRGYEGGITLLSSYLAISSFFQSSLYLTIAGGINQILRMFNIKAVSSSQVTLYIPLIVTAIVALLIIYDYYMGSPEDIIDIYQINLLLITPEAMSYSRLDWLNLIKRPQILEPTRSSLPIFLTGAIILFGYLSLYFISKSRADLDDLRSRGVDEYQLDHLFEKQSRLSVVYAFLSVFITVTVFLFSTPFTSMVTSIMGGLSFSYLIFGLPGIMLILAALWLFLKIEEKKV
jgi:hypothetical protein